MMVNKYFKYSWVKENLSLIVLVPTVLGGLSQLLELLALGTPYLRFFSVTQLISDGLLVLFFGLVVCLIMWVTLRNTDFFETFGLSKPVDEANSIATNDHTNTNDSNTRSKPYWSLLVAIIVIILSICYWGPMIKTTSSHQGIYPIEIVIAVFGIVLLMIAVKTIIVTVFDFFTWKVDLSNKRTMRVMKAIFLFFVISACYGIIRFIPLWHSAYMLSDDLMNTTYIDCKIKRMHSNLKSFEIQYFNDKYIFVRLQEKSGRQWIEFLKFEDFLNDDACTKQSR